MRRVISALAIGLLAFSSNGWAAEPAPKTLDGGAAKGEDQKLPGQALWDVQALEASFTIVSTRYDAATPRVVWVLEAKKQATCPGYHAVFRDFDKVRLADTTVALTPSKKAYAKGERVSAALTLPTHDDFVETGTVIVLPAR
jgi:hypothetical protein